MTLFMIQSWVIIWIYSLTKPKTKTNRFFQRILHFFFSSCPPHHTTPPSYPIICFILSYNCLNILFCFSILIFSFFLPFALFFSTLFLGYYYTVSLYLFSANLAQISIRVPFSSTHFLVLFFYEKSTFCSYTLCTFPSTL
jgi:hypothetical protein